MLFILTIILQICLYFYVYFYVILCKHITQITSSPNPHVIHTTWMCEVIFLATSITTFPAVAYRPSEISATHVTGLSPELG